MLRKFSVLFFICLLFSCSDIALRTYIERMTGFENIIYVSIDSGNDLNRGVKTEPLKTIQAGIDKAYGYIADGLAETVEVYVAVGLYEVNYREGHNIVVKEGVSLYGGYSSDFITRDTVNNSTVIIDLSDSGGIAGDTNQTVTVPSGVTENTILDGFVIKGGSGDLSTALYIVSSSPTITNNFIYAGSAGGIAAAVSSVDAARPLIGRNEIYGGSSTVINIGIFISRDSLPVIQENIITGGTSGSSNNGVLVQEGSNVTITDNNIDGGVGTKTFAVVCGTDSRMTVEGNYIFGGSAESEACAVKNQGFYNEIKNNVIDGGRTVDGTATGIISDTENGTKIYNNIIFGGKASGAGDSFGIICNSGAAAVYNNTIAGGESDWSAAISLQNESTPIIENNILFSVAVSGGYCIYESTSNNGNAQSIHNNDFHDIEGNTIFYHTFGEADIDTLGDIDLLGYAGGNWDADPLLIDPDGTDDDFSTMNDNDWHLKADSPAEVRQGGLDGSLSGWGFETDFDGLTRTNLAAGPDNDPANDNAGGWSMGACEKDN